jgi:hypothetical protein
VHNLEQFLANSKNLRGLLESNGARIEKRKHPMSPERADPTKQRRFPRYPLDVRVSVKVFRAEAPLELWGRSNELGQDGIGVTLTGELNSGEVATLELVLPGGGPPLKLRALVRYRDGLRHGFEFLARDEMQRASIGKTCELLSIGR